MSGIEVILLEHAFCMAFFFELLVDVPAHEVLGGDVVDFFDLR